MRNAPVILGREGKDAADAASSDQRAAEERSERFRFSLPLLVLAAASLALSYVLFHEALAPHTTRVPLWVLAFSVGVIASAGGSASLLVGDFSGESWLKEARASPEFVVVRRGEWLALQERLNLATGASTTSPTGSPVGTFELPEWEEAPTMRSPSTLPAPAADMSPPAPMAISRGIDSLATEVERLVADLESAATAQAPAPAPSVPPATVAPTAPTESTRTSTPAPVSRAAEKPDPPVGASPSGETMRKAARAAPSGRLGPRPSERPQSEPQRPATAVAGNEAELEYRALLAELEERAARPGLLPRRELPTPVPTPPPSPDARCVGCDARLGAGEPTEPCESCRSPMCAACRDRSAKEGYRGLCAVCSILAESEARGDKRNR